MKAEILHRQKLKELGYKDEAIEDIVNKYIGDCTYEFAESYHEELSQPKDNWISVEDRLPINDDEVLCVIKGWDDMDYQRTLSYDVPHKEWGDWNGEEYNTVVTHWQPLPEPPKQ